MWDSKSVVFVHYFPFSIEFSDLKNLGPATMFFANSTLAQPQLLQRVHIIKYND